MKMVHGGFTVFAAAVAVAVLGGCKWVACGAGDCRSPLPEPTAKGAAEPTVMSFWKGKKVAFLGDSITDPRHVGCTANYWNYLAQSIGIDAYVYGVNGARSRGIVPQAEKAVRDLRTPFSYGSERTTSTVACRVATGMRLPRRRRRGRLAWSSCRGGGCLRT